MSDLTRNGLKYRYVGRAFGLNQPGYVCRRCDLVVKAQSGSAGWQHACVPQTYDGKLAKIDPDASVEEQYEALSVMFAELAAKVREWEGYGKPDKRALEHAKKAERERDTTEAGSTR